MTVLNKPWCPNIQPLDILLIVSLPRSYSKATLSVLSSAEAGFSDVPKQLLRSPFSDMWKFVSVRDRFFNLSDVRQKAYMPQTFLMIKIFFNSFGRQKYEWYSLFQ